MKKTSFILNGVLVLALGCPLSSARAQLTGTAADNIQEIVDVVDEVAKDSQGAEQPAAPASAETLPAVPVPLGNAPQGTPAEPMLTPETTPVDLTKPVKLADLPSLFFTFWEHNAIKDARNARGAARPPDDSEFVLPEGEKLERIKPPPEEREIKLGGIVYTHKGDWTIWLNSKQIKPDALPKEIVELRVYKEYIEVKWLDDYTQQIYPIRLRPHQRFNLDSRIFLPG